MSKYVYHPDKMIDNTTDRFYKITNVEELNNPNHIYTKELLKDFFNLDRAKEDMDDDNWKHLFGTWVVTPGFKGFSPFILLHFLDLLGINPIADWSESEIKFIFGDGILKYTPIITKEED